MYNVQFWQDASDYELYKTRTGDQRGCVSRAWHIFNKYISSDAACNIGQNVACQAPNFYTLLTSSNINRFLLFLHSDIFPEYIVDFFCKWLIFDAAMKKLGAYFLLAIKK